MTLQGLDIVAVIPAISALLIFAFIETTVISRIFIALSAASFAIIPIALSHAIDKKYFKELDRRVSAIEKDKTLVEHLAKRDKLENDLRAAQQDQTTNPRQISLMKELLESHNDLIDKRIAELV